MLFFRFGQLQVSIDYLAQQLIPDLPNLPNAANNTVQSANNALAGRTNEPRVLQRIEDIYGTVRPYPSLLQPVYPNILTIRNMNIAICALVAAGIILMM